jgi:hypothetical protein
MRAKPFALLLRLSLTAALLPAMSCSNSTGTSADEAVEIQGIVYASVLIAMNAPDTSINPVVGAIVSTSLDSRTATTDANGRFDLVSTAPHKKCAPYLVTITAAGHPTYSVQWTTGGKQTGQTFVLSTGDPKAIATTTAC